MLVMQRTTEQTKATLHNETAEGIWRLQRDWKVRDCHNYEGSYLEQVKNMQKFFPAVLIILKIITYISNVEGQVITVYVVS